MYKKILQLIRPYQWVKNLFIAAPMLFSFKITFHNSIAVLLGIMIFSLSASAIYIFNDLYDVKEDRLHPKKKFRPIASGVIPIRLALLFFFILLIISLIFAWLINLCFFYVIVIYLIMNILYTIWFKHIAIVDITIIAIGFILRIFAGAYLINTNVSMWIILVTFWLALFLALAKRRDEYLHFLNGKKVRKNIEGYNLEIINNGMIMLATITVVAYVMYTVSPEVIKKIGSDKLYLSSIFVVMGIMRYLQITFVFQKSGEPTKILLKDKFLQIVILLWLISFYLIHEYGKYI
jgi:decaprenyl-phosphate phosphoribosyltransferase